MKKRLISLIMTTVFMLSSMTAVVASDYLAEPFTDDFSNKSASESVWKVIDNMSSGANRFKPIAESENAVTITGDNIMKVTPTSSSAKHAVYELDEYVLDNLKINLKVRPVCDGTANDQITTITFTGSKNSGEAIATELSTIYFRYNSGKMYVAFDHTYGMESYGGKSIATVENYNSQDWYNLEIIVYSASREVGVKFNGNNEVKKGFATHQDWNMKPTDVFDGVSRIGFGANKTSSSSTWLEIDDVSIVKDVPLTLNSQNIEDGTVNISNDTKIELDFNKKIANANVITLKDNTGNTVLCDIDDTSKKVIITPRNKLSSLTTYTLTIPASVQAVDGKVLGTEKIITFTTQLVDDLVITNSTFDGNSFSATIKNESENPITATSRLVTYKLVNGVKQYISEISEPITINETYSYSKALTDLPEDYVVSLSLLDGTKPLCPETAFNKDGIVTDVSEIVGDSEDSTNIDYQSGVVSIAKKIGTLAYVHKAIEVKNETGAVIYFDQLLTNENGSTKFDFVPCSNIVASNYTITVNGTEMSAETVENLEVDYRNFYVEITKPEITSEELTAGNKTNAKYNFVSVIGEEEGESSYEWFIGETADGSFTSVGTTTVNEYTLRESDECNYIKVKVTPKTKLGLAVGEGKESDAVKILTLPRATNVTISGTAKVGNTLTGNFTYSHKENANRVDTTYRWLTADSISGTYKEVGTGINYALTSADAGKYIKFEVTPSCDVEPKTGKPVESSPVHVEKKTKGSGGGGGGSSSGSGIGGFVAGLSSQTMTEIKETETVEEVETGVFADIEKHWAKENITKLYDMGIVNGDAEGNFNPDNKITRAEFTAMIVRMLKLDELTYIKMFDDVVAKDWYAKAIQTAVSNGIVKGDGDNFRPNDSITRQEMAIIAMSAYELKMGELSTGKINCEDVDDISSWAIDAVSKAYTAGIINGKGDNRFEPKTNTTRAEAATVIIRIADRVF